MSPRKPKGADGAGAVSEKPLPALPQRIVLTGFMGSGKSSVGRRLAERVKRPFFDLDRVIESAAGATVAKIITRQGEEAFRALEAREAARVARIPDTVIATGGGTLLDETRAASLIGEGARVFVLGASVDELVERLSVGRLTRPLLGAGDIRERIVELLGQRRERYEALGEAVDTTGKDVDETVSLILERIEADSEPRIG